MHDDIALWTVSEVAEAIRRREASSEEVTKLCLRRIEEWQPAINCFISVDADEALKIARERDSELAKGEARSLLHGVPLAHKDNFLRRGKICTAGSAILRDTRASITATAIARLDAAGAVNLGGLNMSEFAIGPAGHNEHYGDCRNPWHRDFISGGSSSGSAAAVAARLVYGALGSDTGGSIRGPASHCGVVGLKPTYGRVSRYGVVPRSWTTDCAGPIARTVRDCARILAVIAGFDPRDSTSSRRPVANYESLLGSGIDELRIAIPDDLHQLDLSDEVRTAFEGVIDVLRDHSVRISRVAVPDPKALFALGDTVLKCEGSAIHQRWLRERPHDYSVHARARLDAGFHIPSTRYIEALSLRKLMLKDFLQAVFTRAETLLVPCVGITTPKRSEVQDGSSHEVAATVWRLTALTRPYSYLGLPSLCIPCGRSRTGLPIAFQAVGRPFDEATLFRVGHAFQQMTAWHIPVPELAHHTEAA